LATVERLQKVLARAGIASRRMAEQLILQGRVTVNGPTVSALGTEVEPGRDVIAVDGQPLGGAEAAHYLVVHKPVGYVSSARDERGRPSVVSLVPRLGRLFPVGRLDVESSGLLLLTNDGDLAFRLTHPRFQVAKEYDVVVRGRITPQAVTCLRTGVDLEEGRTAAAEVSVVEADDEQSRLAIVLRQGWKRQVRRMCAVVGHPVVTLRRVRLDGLELGSLEPGRWRALTPAEVERLKGAGGAAEAHRHRRRRG
jgi:23S rRNA pseudouridine2605 synthase